MSVNTRKVTASSLTDGEGWDRNVTSTALALLAVHRIERAGGLQLDVSTGFAGVGAHALRTALEELHRFGLGVPAGFVQELDRAAALYDLLAVTTADSTLFGLHDLASPEPRRRWLDWLAMSGAYQGGRKPDHYVRSELDNRTRQGVTRHAPSLIEVLSGFYAENAHDLHHTDEKSITGNERDRRLDVRARIDKLHRALLNWGPPAPGPAGIEAEICTRWSFTQKAWNALKEGSRPDYGLPSPDGINPANAYDAYVGFGGVPRLARTRLEAFHASQRLMLGHRAYLHRAAAQGVPSMAQQVEAAIAEAVERAARDAELAQLEAETLREAIGNEAWEELQQRQAAEADARAWPYLQAAKPQDDPQA